MASKMAAMAQMTRPAGIHILYVISLIKINIFPIFQPKMWKIAIHLRMRQRKKH